MRQISDASSYGEAIGWSMHAKRVTYRRYGLNGELRRPMIHRFEVRGGEPVTQLMANSIMQTNGLLKRLMKRGK